MLGPSFILHSGSICPTWGFCFAGPLSLHCPHPFYFTSFLSFITPLTHISSSYADTYMYMTCRQDSPEKSIEQDITQTSYFPRSCHSEQSCTSLPFNYYAVTG
ncbi:hypothetical protein BO99DRAFT_223335 [Aspergillus violaceofuscus CBS 115571]|uniref:Uncharacterized protein n=1 Tax=Aspergillus violaceofuscus (strain CBS 115571) TaxID=1450538 RepID=A0A2V5HH19_ASPV1|nr:hypothetical protein BO99DRAFT_223335 [Aspergillus violaceofuscus CBS 115571]